MKRQTIKRLVRLLLSFGRPLCGRFPIRTHTTIRPPPQRQRFPRFSAGAADGSWGGDRVPGICVSCAAILKCPAYHQNSFRLLSKTYVLATCWTRHISPPNGHPAPYPHKSSRCPFPEHLIIRRFCKRTLLDMRYTSTPEVWPAENQQAVSHCVRNFTVTVRIPH